jgi:hypothetical protein
MICHSSSPPRAQPHNLPTHGAELSDDPSSQAYVIPGSIDVVCSSEPAGKNWFKAMQGSAGGARNQQERAVRIGTGVGVATI